MMKQFGCGICLLLAACLLCACVSGGNAEIPTETLPAEPAGTTLPPQETTVPAPATVAAYTTTGVHVRTEPSAQAEIYTTLEPHTDVQLIGRLDGWSEVLIDDAVYYIKSDYLRKKLPANGYLIVIDPGHQAKGNSETEPIGPGAAEVKAKVSGGTYGRTTGLAEYELNLQVALKLQTELENRGYTVIMIRTSHDVDISNSQRAAIANEADADAFIRIHANGSEDPTEKGAMTICQTPNNPYNGDLYEDSYSLSACVLEELVASTGCYRQKVWETDTMSGINWCRVPVTIVEMGYMTNPEEDKLLASPIYQYWIAAGIANGIDCFLGAG